MVTLLDLPAELILHTLWFLDLKDLIACQITHQSLYAIIKDSVLFNYLRALKAAGMEDNRLCTVGNMSERLRLLNIQENAWSTCLFDSPQTIPIPVDPIYFSTLDGGMYFFWNYRSLHYISLHSKPSDEARWRKIDPGYRLEAVGFAIYEHDLIAIAVSSSINDEEPEYHILLFEAFTGKHHPLAQNPRISITHLSISVVEGISIAGNHIALAGTGYLDFENEYISIYEWKTGVLKRIIMAPVRSYRDVLFLSQSVLLVPNKGNNTFEFWDIPELPDVVPRAHPNGALALPPLKDQWFVTHIACSCRPFFGLHETHYSSVPFYSSAADAIAVFNIVLRHSSASFVSAGFFMIVHHRSLLNLCPTSSSPLMPIEPDAKVNVVPWDEWGPAVTRLYHTNSALTSISSMNSTQRCTFLNNAWEAVILDFNPARVHSLRAMLSDHRERMDTSRLSIVTGDNLVDYDYFEKRPASRLPYIRWTLKSLNPLDEICIDNEQLVGIRLDDSDVTQLDIWHRG